MAKPEAAGWIRKTTRGLVKRKGFYIWAGNEKNIMLPITSLYLKKMTLGSYI